MEEQSITEEHNAVGSGERSLDFSLEQWETWVNANLESFEGSKNNAARLLYETTTGMKWLNEKLKTKGLSDLKMPTLVVLTKEEGPHPIGHTSGFVYIKQSFLEEYSNLSMTDTYTVTRADGEVAYQGMIPSLFRLAGVEECHHEIFEQYKGRQKGIDSLAQSIAEYDAQNIEYQALRMQLRHALEQNMNSMTITKLEDRIEKAGEIRKQEKST